VAPEPFLLANRGSSSSEAASVAGTSELELGTAPTSLGAEFNVRLAVPSGAGLGGRTLGFSTSRCAISCSICALNSLEARRNSFMYLPI